MRQNEINIKNRTYYFYNNVIDLDEFDVSKTKVDKKDFNDIDIYYLGYEHKKKISECNVINSVNPLYLKNCRYEWSTLKKVKMMHGI